MEGRYWRVDISGNQVRGVVSPTFGGDAEDEGGLQGVGEGDGPPAGLGQCSHGRRALRGNEIKRREGRVRGGVREGVRVRVGGGVRVRVRGGVRVRVRKRVRERVRIRVKIRVGDKVWLDVVEDLRGW